MIPIREILASITAKINKPFAWCVFVNVYAHISGYAQSNAKAVYDANEQEIILMNGTDSMASIKIDKFFYAKLNHEKKRKNKTVYYRLAQYDHPIDVQKVPVTIANNDIQLHLLGTLQGDTVAKFSCIFRSVTDGLTMEIEVPEISVNEFSFCLKVIKKNVTITNKAENTKLFLKEKKKKCTLVSLHGNKYWVGFTALSDL